MQLNNIWGYGQLFGFSGIDGVNRYYNDFVGTLTEEKIGIRFELKKWIKAYFPIKGQIQFNAITGDMIDAETQNGAVFITFVTADALVGYSPVLPEFFGKGKWRYKKTRAIFEFYAPEEGVAPYECKRKGKPSTPPDWRKHVHSIIDFNWSACFTLMFIQDELY